MYLFNHRCGNLRTLRKTISAITRAYMNSQIDDTKMNGFCSLADRLIKTMELEDKEGQDDNDE
jgi:hypothetical protein